MSGTSPPEIARDNLVSTLVTLLEGEARIVVVEGVSGIGKSTLLRQFVAANASRTFSIVVSSASRWAYDPAGMTYELCSQVERRLKGRDLPPDVVVDDTLLRRSIHSLARAARKSGDPFYLILDGIEEIPESDDATRRQLLDLLPFGVEGFRFLLSGSLDQLPLSEMARKTGKTFPLPYFNQLEAERYLENLGLSRDQLVDLYKSTRGTPGHLASVRRLLTSQPSGANSLLQNLPRELPGLFQLEWNAVKAGDNEQLLLLAILSHENRRYTSHQLSQVSGFTKAVVKDRLAGLSFISLVVEDAYEFVSESYRQFAAIQLSSLRQRVNDLFIDSLLRNPDTDESLSSLPSFFSSANRLADLVRYLSPERFARLYQRAPSLRLVQQRADEGMDAARKLQRDDDLVRFSIQKAAINEIASSEIGASEVSALAAIGDYETAFALADQSTRAEVRFRLLVAIARVRREQDLPVDANLVQRIRDLFVQLDPNAFKQQLPRVAADLFHTAPDLALELVNRAAGDQGENSLDWALARLSVQAQLAANDPHARDSARTIAERISDPIARRLSTEASMILSNLSAGEATSEAEELEGTGDRLYVLQQWMLVNAEREDAHEVLEYGTKAAVQATAYSANAMVYRQLATCLPYMNDVQKVSYYIGLLDSQRPVLEILGPPEEFIRLRLTLARAEWRHDRVAARARFLEVYNAIDRIKERAVKTACLARLASALARTDPDRELDKEGDELHQLTEQELNDGIEELLVHSAAHFEACRGVIQALAFGKPESALALISKMNTEPRRDQAYSTLITAMSGGSRAHIDVACFNKALDSIADPSVLDDALASSLTTLSRRGLSDADFDHLYPVLSRVIDIKRASTRSLICATVLSNIADNRSQQATTLRGSLEQSTDISWSHLEDGWEKLDLGFEIVTRTAKSVSQLAHRYVDKVNDLKQRLTIQDLETITAASTGIRLAIRAFGGLAQHNLDGPDDLERIVSAVSQMGGTREQANLIATLALQFFDAERLDDCAKIVESRLVPLVLSIPRDDEAFRETVVIDIAPALYVGAPASATAIFATLSDVNRDRALSATVWFLLTKTAPWDPVEWRPRIGCDISFEEAGKIIALLRQFTADWPVYMFIETLVDSATGSTHRDNFKRGQRAEIARQLEEVVAEQFPNTRYIRHAGYQIVSSAQINRLKEPKDAVPHAALAAAARKVPNQTDRAYILGILAATSRTVRERGDYLDEAREVTETIPMLADRIDLYHSMARELIDVDEGKSKELLKKALALCFHGEGSTIAKRRESLIDLAYRVYPDSAASMASTTDDDPAKAKIENQLRLYRIKDTMAMKRAPANPPTIRNAFEISRAAWLKLGALNAGRSNPVSPDRVLPLLQYAAEQPVSDAYPIFAWFLENAVQHARGTEQTRTYVLPLFEACLRGAELAIRTSLRVGSTGHRLLQYGELLGLPKETTIVADGEKAKGLNEIEQWLSRTRPRQLWIVEPYFRPEDMVLLALVQRIADDCETLVLAGTTESLRDVAPPYDEAFRAAWTRISGEEPPTATIIFTASSISKKPPIHDRWWLSDSGGLSLGTSFGGLGSRISEVRLLTPEEAAAKMQIVAPLFARSRVEFEGERLSYLSLTL